MSERKHSDWAPPDQEELALLREMVQEVTRRVRPDLIPKPPPPPLEVGRNDPCPCGSGKKFKRCHGAEEDREQT